MWGSFPVAVPFEATSLSQSTDAVTSKDYPGRKETSVYIYTYVYILTCIHTHNRHIVNNQGPLIPTSETKHPLGGFCSSSKTTIPKSWVQLEGKALLVSNWGTSHRHGNHSENKNTNKPNNSRSMFSTYTQECSQGNQKEPSLLNR